jgi:hypothetical protein
VSDAAAGPALGAPSSRHTREAVGVAILLAAALALGSVARDALVGAFNDDGVYVALGKALAEGSGYRSVYLAGAPVHLKYPPLLPGILALLWQTGSLAAVQALAITLATIASAAAGGLLWWLARGRLGLAAPAAAFFVAGPFLLDSATQYFTLIISEPYFLLGWAGALVLAQRLHDAPPAAGVRAGAALGLVAAATTLARTQGVVLVATLPALLLLRRETRRAGIACAAAALLPLVLWVLVRAAATAAGPLPVEPDESYGGFVGGAGAFVANAMAAAWWNLRAYPSVFRDYVVPWPAAGTALLVAGVVLTGAGGWLLRRRAPAVVATVAANAALVLVWPFTQDRLLLAILPVAGVLAAAAATHAIQGWRRPARLAAAGAFALVALAAGARQLAIRRDAGDAVQAGRAPRESRGTPRYALLQSSVHLHAMSRWVVASTVPAARLFSVLPAGVFLYTGRQGASIDPAESPFVRSVFAEPGRYVARRAVTDRIGVIVADHPRGRAMAEVRAIGERCPDAVGLAGGTGPVFFALRLEDPCLGAVGAGVSSMGPAVGVSDVSR